jgi:Predicted N-acetylglucosaminyl transferase
MSSEFNLTSLQVEELEKELEENPFNIRALSELAQYFASQSDYASACKHYEKIVRVDEENGKA